ncbi:MAG: ATP-binding protein [Sporomusaceae bacterium]|nr:ATP-binding protein [Sporomusaceae bacterium]
MNKLQSITYRITGLTFFIVAVTVLVLIYLANYQMTQLFQEYLVGQQLQMNHGGPMLHSMNGQSGQAILMGPLEDVFLSSVHQSLVWVGLIILLVALAVSYLLARSITIPLRKLSQAAQQIEQGHLGETVQVTANDEVGHLAVIFNRMSETLAANNQLRRQLLANIAHELRTPLAIIQGNLEAMVDGVIAPNKEQLSSLHEEAVRLNRLIRDLRDLSLAEVRQLVLEKESIDLSQLLTRTVSMLRPLAEEKHLSINLILAENLPQVTVDVDRMCQVFYNILGNAIRYSPSDGEIEVAASLLAEKTASWLKVTVKDHGPGISPEDLPHVFDHFYRGDKSRDRKSGGSGIGLAIVKQLVENHGGQVRVESVAGDGSLFQVLLPCEK